MVIKIDTEKLLSVPEAARYLEMSKSAVHELIKRAMLPAIKVGGRYVIKLDAVEIYKGSDAWKRGQEHKERIKPKQQEQGK